VLGSAGDEVLDPHVPGGLDLLPGREAPDPFGLLALFRSEVFTELAGFCLAHLVLLAFFDGCDTTVSMARQSMTSQTPRKKPGPPATGKGTPITVRLQPPELALLDEWIAEQEIPPSRPEAIRYHFKRSLAAKAGATPKKGKR
jgi:hypothetical protein